MLGRSNPWISQALGSLAAGLLVVAGWLAMPTAAHAADLKDLKTSLELVPAGAVRYGSVMRLGELYRIAKESRAWERFTNLEAVQLGWASLQESLDEDPDFADLRAFYESDDVQEALPVLTDLANEEIFYYLDGDWERLEKLQLKLSARAVQQQANSLRDAIEAMQSGDFEALSELLPDTGLEGDEDPEADATDELDPAEVETLRMMLEVAAENPDLVAVPTTVLGFRISKPAAVGLQLGKFAAMMEDELKELPPRVVKEPLKQVEIDGNTYFQIQFSAEAAIDLFDEVPPEELNITREQLSTLRKKLEEMPIVVSVGVWNNRYLLVTVGPDSKHIETLGEGKLLRDQAVLDPVAPFADRPLLALDYSSASWQRAATLPSQMAVGPEFYEQAFEIVTQAIRAGAVPDEMRQRLLEDIKELRKDITPGEVIVGPALSWSFLTEEGVEGYEIVETNLTVLDGSRPLNLAKHLGGEPFAAGVLRPRATNSYALLRKWTQTGYGYVNDFLVPQMEPEDREKFEQSMKVALPLARQFDEITQTQLLPAMKDVELGVAVVPGVKINPPVPVGLITVPEPALVIHADDPQKLLTAVASYREWLNEALTRLADATEEIGEPLRIPPPDRVEDRKYTMYAYPLPEEAVDAIGVKFGLYLGLGEKVGVISTSKRTTDRLLDERPLLVPGGLEDVDNPLAALSVSDWEGVVDTYRPPFVAIAQFAALSLPAEELPEGITPAMIVDHVNATFELLQIYRGGSTQTKIEGNRIITHSREIYRDIP